MVAYLYIAEITGQNIGAVVSTGCRSGVAFLTDTVHAVPLGLTTYKNWSANVIFS